MNTYALASPFPEDAAVSRSERVSMSAPRRAEFVDLLRRRWPHPCILGVALFVSELLSTYPVVADADGLSGSRWVVQLLAARLLTMLAVMLTITTIQVWLPRPLIRRRLLLIIVVVAICIASPAIQTSHTWAGLNPLWTMLGEGQLALFLYLLWLNMVFGILLVVLYEWQMRTDQLATAVRDARIADEALATQALEARLNGMKARVDPEFLFAVIAQAELRYGEDVGAGERMLDALIEFLRATLPRRVDSRAALGSEVRLCEAYLALESNMRRDRLSFTTASDRVLLASRFPPAVLLPLLRTLLPSQIPSEPLTSPAISVAIEVRRQLSRLVVVISCSATSQSALYLLARSRQSLAAASTTLRAFFGSDANVDIKVVPTEGYVVTLDVPYVADVTYASEVPNVAS